MLVLWLVLIFRDSSRFAFGDQVCKHWIFRLTALLQHIWRYISDASNDLWTHARACRACKYGFCKDVVKITLVDVIETELSQFVGASERRLLSCVSLDVANIAYMAQMYYGRR